MPRCKSIPMFVSITLLRALLSVAAAAEALSAAAAVPAWKPEKPVELIVP
ncbi:MAG: hypothetical protein ACXWCY_15900 [Burkholderiales bacterium]